MRYRLRKVSRFKYPLAIEAIGREIILFDSIPAFNSYENGVFTFLNLSQKFDEKIDWNFAKFGKLWTYNLTYFDFLNQQNLGKDKGLQLIYDFIDQIDRVKDGLEPFPISLRGINWIKFLVKHNIKDKKIDETLYAQYLILLDNLEYHLLGNHLLENGFSLLFGAYYFRDEKFYEKAKEILKAELEEQILDDGAHFELSPMYHQIMLFRILDSINLIQNSSWQKQELLGLFKLKAELMLGWLKNIIFKNGNIPLFNDSTNGIAPTSKDLFQYSNNLKLKIKNSTLKKSGYRKVVKNRYECIVDIGNIGPDYIPGHAHADTFNFEIYIDGKPFIIDTGISTYEANRRREIERSTSSHNTVEVNDTNQSEVWGSFRVANRAYIVDFEEKAGYIKAIHNGYEKKFKTLHQREFIFKEDCIRIIDTLFSKKVHKAIARLHFHPDVTQETIDKHIKIKHSTFNIQHYKYAPEFNKLIEAKMVEIPFTKKLEVEIKV